MTRAANGRGPKAREYHHRGAAKSFNSHKLSIRKRLRHPLAQMGLYPNAGLWHPLSEGVLLTTSAEFLACKNLVAGVTIDVETKTRHYRIECLGGSAVRISGHPEYCPTPVTARLHGSVDKEGQFELGMIGRGRRLMFLLDERRPVTTSRVLHLRVDQPKEVHASTTSIH
jgi:hypothetical protein